MDRPSDHSVVKVLISTVEYRRLLHIEKKYLELEQKYNSQSSEEKKLASKLEDKSLNIQNQVGSGLLSNNLANFAKVVAQFMLKENKDLLSARPEFVHEVKHSLQHLFGQTSLGN